MILEKQSADAGPTGHSDISKETEASRKLSGDLFKKQQTEKNGEETRMEGKQLGKTRIL